MFRNEIERTGGGRQRGSNGTGDNNVVVAVKAEKVISRTALAWALTHVVHPGDCITLLAVFSGEKTGRRLWNFPIFSGDCGSNRHERLPDRIGQISESCSQMVLQFHNQIEVTVRIKVVLGASGGAVAAEAKSSGANWVVLDKKLTQQRKHCMEELRCNIVVMKGSQPKVLRLNLGCTDETQTPFFSAASSPLMDVGKLRSHRMKHSTPASSPEEPSTSFTRTTGEGSLSSFDSATSVFLVYGQNPLFEGSQKGSYKSMDEQNDLEESLSTLDLSREKLITLSKAPTSAMVRNQNAFWIPQNHIVDGKPPAAPDHRNCRKTRSSNFKVQFDENVEHGQPARKSRVALGQNYNKEYIINSSIRDAVSLGRPSSVPPPLCSLCQNKTPLFGKPPRQFSYRELEEATKGFSEMNFLAEGGFGVVHKGVLRDGQVVAVKQLRFGGSQADADFCREVRVLSCAQHRNVVLLIGYCIEDKMRVLVYEYICNSSLDFHLHGMLLAPIMAWQNMCYGSFHKPSAGSVVPKKISRYIATLMKMTGNGTSLDWHSRLKIATGTARGLRYLHEDCRVGCVVHRDLRPNNILLTHDFEPLVSDFGLARWHSEWDIITEDRVFGASGYLAPEYVDGGQITHKVDVYAFGVVLLELMTGHRITDLQNAKGMHLLADWFRPLATLESNLILPNSLQLLDPSLSSDQSPEFLLQLQAMGRAAFMCLRQDPDSRPQMSKVLRVLEGGDPLVPLGLDLNSVGSRSGHLHGLSSRSQPELRINHSRKLSH